MVSKKTFALLTTFSMEMLILVVLLYLGPGIGSEVATALPVCSTGDFGTTTYTTGASVWATFTKLIGIVVLINMIALGISGLQDLRGNDN